MVISLARREAGGVLGTKLRFSGNKILTSERNQPGRENYMRG